LRGRRRIGWSEVLGKYSSSGDGDLGKLGVEAIDMKELEVRDSEEW
jgi:hypothetical protein